MNLRLRKNPLGKLYQVKHLIGDTVYWDAYKGVKKGIVKSICITEGEGIVYSVDTGKNILETVKELYVLDKESLLDKLKKQFDKKIDEVNLKSDLYCQK